MQWLTADVPLDDPLRPNKRFHEKMWIVDGESSRGMAIIGGLNVANEYFRVDLRPEHRWRDQDVALRGPIVRDVASAFDRNYLSFKAEKSRLAFNPDRAWKRGRAALRRLPRLIHLRGNAELARAVRRAAARHVELSFQPVTARFIHSRPRQGESYILQAYLNLIDRAEKSIEIANAYFFPSKAVREALQRAARRGVQVTILTNSPASNDIRSIATLSRFAYVELLSVNEEDAVQRGTGRPIALREWTGPLAGEGTLHAKYAVFDGREAIVGSYNLDPRSEELDSETVLAVEDVAFAARLRDMFTRRDLPKTEPITLEQARTFRLPEGIDHLFRLVYALPLRNWL
jgi:putative cardiolipin synthase